MIYLIFGIIVTTIGVLLRRWGNKMKSNEIKNGSLGLVFGGLVLLFVGIIIMLFVEI